MNYKYSRKLYNQFIEIKKNLTIFLVAIIFYLFWYITDLYKLTLNFFNLNISIGHVGYLVLLIIPFFKVIKEKKLKKIWIFFSTLTILDLINMIYITNGKLNKVPQDFFNGYFLIFLIISFIVAFLLSIANKKYIVNQKDITLIIIISIIFILFYRVSNFYLFYYKHISNKDRSIFINNLEIHHISYGIFFLIFTPLIINIMTQTSKKIKFLIIIFLGFIYGTVFDEAYYYINKYTNELQYDNLYLNNITVMFFSFLIIIISLISWLFLYKKDKKNVQK